MRLEILSTDRVGISQEILAVFAKQRWNINQLEVSTGATYVQLAVDSEVFTKVEQAILTIVGVSQCRLVELLPSELRAKHLTALLAKIPDAIFDLNADGEVLVANQVAIDLVPQQQVVGANIKQLFNLNMRELLSSHQKQFELSFASKTYLAGVQPVYAKGQVNGALLTLKAAQQLGRQIAFMQQHQPQGIDHMLGLSTEMSSIRQQVKQFAQLDLPVLIRGETGTGKELLARALHESSGRSVAPFLAINCAALPEHLLESELFGYAAGAFTGARKGGKPGLFELAEGGTVFLDEIAEMSNYLQAKLLRFLQDFRYRRVGGTQELQADVRILSASHQNLGDMLTEQSFRADLYYRLNVLQIELPPLRQRLDDIIVLAKHFIAEAASQVNRATPMLTEQALVMLKSYHWPGNIRQLQNVLFRVVALTESNQLSAAAIEHALANDSYKKQGADMETVVDNSQPIISAEVVDDNEVIDWASAQAQFERQLLEQLYPLYPTTRKLAQRLKVSHNKIAMKLRAYRIR